jgi:hypothetical protein
MSDKIIPESFAAQQYFNSQFSQAILFRFACKLGKIEVAGATNGFSIVGINMSLIRFASDCQEKTSFAVT